MTVCLEGRCSIQLSYATNKQDCKSRILDLIVQYTFYNEILSFRESLFFFSKNSKSSSTKSQPKQSATKQATIARTISDNRIRTKILRGVKRSFNSLQITTSAREHPVMINTICISSLKVMDTCFLSFTYFFAVQHCYFFQAHKNKEMLATFFELPSFFKLVGSYF